MNQIGFKQMEYLSVFYSKAFEYQTHFYKAKLKAGERVGELCKEALTNGHATLTMQDLYMAFHAFHQKELLALYQTHRYKATSQELSALLPVVTKINRDHLENLMFPLPMKMILHLRYPYYRPLKKENALVPDIFPELNSVNNESAMMSLPPEKKKRKE
jgi:hypothetical protein